MNENRKSSNRMPPAGSRGRGMGPGGAMPERPADMVGTWKKLLISCRRFWPVIIISLICAAGGTILTILGPDKLKDMTAVITAGILTGIDMEKVRCIGLTLVAFYVVSSILSIVQHVLMTEVTHRFTRDMRGDISHKINRLPISYYNHTSTGDILSRVTNDVDTCGQSLSSSAGTLVSSVTLFLGSLFMMLKTDLLLTFTAVAATMIGFSIMFAIMGKSQKYFAAQQKNLGIVNGQVEEVYSGHTVVKAYNGEETVTREFRRANDALRESGFRAACLSGMMPPVMGFIGNLGYVAVCVVGAMRTISGKMGFEVIVAFILYVRYFNQPLNQIAQAAQSLQQAAAAGERVFGFLEAEEMSDESDKTRRLDKVEGSVEFEHVNFGYDGGRTIISDFSAKAQPGQKIAIVGPTGAGKTTMVNLLMRFYELNGGSIRIDGVPVSEMGRSEVHELFCMVLQDTWLFEGTVRENLIYNTPGVTDDRMREACRAVGLDHFIRTLSNGYDTVLTDQISLSQGQKQQLTIARAMIADRPMLILDEATSSVDTRTEMQIQHAMDELMKGRTSFIIAHRLSTIRNADLILVMNDGNIVESGNHSELLAAGGFYAQLYNSQFEEAG